MIEGDPVLAIGDIMTRELLVLPASATLDEAAQALVTRDIGAAPVRDPAGRIVGVLARSHLVDPERIPAMRAARGARAPALTAADLVTAEFATLRPSDPVTDAVALIVSEAAYRVLVLDDEGELVGIVTASDLLRALAPQAAPETSAAEPQATLPEPGPTVH